eukprot:scaffold3884_cov392-Prasinococcus_capsulatus_cf.AAC.10
MASARASARRFSLFRFASSCCTERPRSSDAHHRNFLPREAARVPVVVAGAPVAAPTSKASSRGRGTNGTTRPIASAVPRSRFGTTPKTARGALLHLHARATLPSCPEAAALDPSSTDWGPDMRGAPRSTGSLESSAQVCAAANWMHSAVPTTSRGAQAVVLAPRAASPLPPSVVRRSGRRGAAPCPAYPTEEGPRQARALGASAKPSGRSSAVVHFRGRPGSARPSGSPRLMYAPLRARAGQRPCSGSQSCGVQGGQAVRVSRRAARCDPQQSHPRALRTLIDARTGSSSASAPAARATLTNPKRGHRSQVEESLPRTAAALAVSAANVTCGTHTCGARRVVGATHSGASSWRSPLPPHTSPTSQISKKARLVPLSRRAAGCVASGAAPWHTRAAYSPSATRSHSTLPHTDPLSSGVPCSAAVCPQLQRRSA